MAKQKRQPVMLRATLLLLLLGLTASQQASLRPQHLGVTDTEDKADALPHIEAHSDYGRLSLRHVPPPPRGDRAATVRAVRTLWLVQMLDHFNSDDQRTWSQRYFVRTDLYRQGGPAFIYIGGESAESAANMGDGGLYMTYLAQRFGAKMFDLEHRYYGSSQPTVDLSSANLVYLSADQALADLAYFIESLRQRGDIVAGQKVVVFGGSYPGNLAVWARLQYPNLIHAAVSSSAPVHAEADFVEYMEVLRRSLDKKAGTWCAQNIKTATDRVVELLGTTAGTNQVKQTFQVGSGLRAKVDLDNFFRILSSPFSQAVQYNRDSTPDSLKNIQNLCSNMAGDRLTGDQAMEQLSRVVLGSLKGNGVSYSYAYLGTVNSYRNTAYGDQGRQWLYQTCTEFGYFQTYSGNGVPFPKAYNDVTFSYNLCKDVFGDSFGQAVADAGVRRTNNVFGDRSPSVTNVVLVNGDIDPWSTLGILQDLNAQAPAIYIDGASHCEDMNYPNPGVDSKDITDAHQRIEQLVWNALYDDYYYEY